ncbi:MAG: ATP-binding protein [Hyphomicrobiaceae bacterium]
MIRLLDTLVARLILVSLVGITLVHIASLWTYEHALDQELVLAHESRLAERLISIKHSLILVPETQREALAHDLSSGQIDAHWSTTRGATPGGPGAEAWLGLTSRIKALAPELGPEELVVGTSTDAHVALLSIRLPDSSWLNVNLFAASPSGSGRHGTLLSTSLMAIGVVIVSLLIARWLTQPLRDMAEAVTALSPDNPRSEVPERGPLEVRQLAAAFNEMRRRIAGLIVRRTRSLAAVSHDLRTPLTRLKLRVNDVGSPQLQRAMAADIAEMEQMIDSTLSYLRGEEASEPQRAIDLTALLQTIIDDAKDAGHDAAFVSSGHVVVNARHIALKRALSNLVANALRFGSRVTVLVGVEGDNVSVTINDNGPGIPEDQLAAVLEPFVRLEASRNSETGGVGLGLAIAKTNIEADGGTLRLRNRPEGGLSAVVRLPVRSVAGQVAASPSAAPVAAESEVGS